jgi:molybdenum cofactor biosynthesis enzyme MoaA
MRIRSIALIVTDDCNFRCAYCYKKRNKDYMRYATAQSALIFFCLGWQKIIMSISMAVSRFLILTS